MDTNAVNWTEDHRIDLDIRKELILQWFGRRKGWDRARKLTRPLRAEESLDSEVP